MIIRRPTYPTYVYCCSKYIDTSVTLSRVPSSHIRTDVQTHIDLCYLQKKKKKHQTKVKYQAHSISKLLFLKRGGITPRVDFSRFLIISGEKGECLGHACIERPKGDLSIT